MTTVSAMAKLGIHTQEWFNAAFENCNAPDWAKRSSQRICGSYTCNIKGQSDPAYIANIIAAEYEKRQ